jgi:hypothetical protein
MRNEQGSGWLPSSSADPLPMAFCDTEIPLPESSANRT